MVLYSVFTFYAVLELSLKTLDASLPRPRMSRDSYPAFIIVRLSVVTAHLADMFGEY